MVKIAEDCMGGERQKSMMKPMVKVAEDFSQLKEKDELFAVLPFIKLVSLGMQTREMMDLTSLLST